MQAIESFVKSSRMKFSEDLLLLITFKPLNKLSETKTILTNECYSKQSLFSGKNSALNCLNSNLKQLY